MSEDPEVSIESLIEKAFATGADSITVRSRAPHLTGYTASISAFAMRDDGNGRSLSQRIASDGQGDSPREALESAFAKIDKRELDAEAEEVAEVADPGRRYAVPGRPGVFVTREELSKELT